VLPTFPVDPEPPKHIPDDDRLHQLWQRYIQLGDPPTTEDVASLLNEISKSDVLSLFPEFDLIYVAKALALARVSNFSEAEEILESAFRKCRFRSALCKALGDTKLWQGETVALGWYMQACLLGYDAYLPYLQLSEAARAFGMVELGNRLLNASDIIGESLHRLSPVSAQRIRSIVEKDPESLRFAIEKFLKFADCFLPPDDVLPLPDNNEREVWFSFLKINPEGWLTPKTKILDRSFVRKYRIGR